jgi:hypothetical protein
MSRLLILLAALFSAQQSVLPLLDLDRELDRLLQEYSAPGASRDVSRLVLIDAQLRTLVPHWDWESHPPASSQTYRDEYAQLGLRVNHYEPEALEYSGKLLREAHAIDPRVFRSHTLYSTLFHDDGESGYLAPDPDAARNYLREFPRGPFAIHANLVLANFYDDLFKFIREMADGSAHETHDCYRPFVDKRPLAQQRREAQRTAIGYYERLTQLLPQSLIMRRSLAEMRSGETEGWYFCGD